MHNEEKDNNRTWMPDSVFGQIWGCYSISQDSRLLEKLVCGSLPMVDYVIRRSIRQVYEDIEKGDIYSYGVLGLMEAIQRYDPDKNSSFTAYALIRIQGAVYDGIMQFRGLRRSYIRKRRLLQLHMEEAQQELERDPTSQEMITRLGIGEEQYLLMAEEENGVNLISLDGLENKECLLKDTRTPELCVEDSMEQNKRQQVLLNAISKLRPIEQMIIYRHYYEGLALREIGRLSGYSHSWISKNHRSAMEQLKNMKIREVLDK